jgi:hypothetical protein
MSVLANTMRRTAVKSTVSIHISLTRKKKLTHDD